MPQRLRIGLVLQGGVGWVGGAEYCKNLAKALYRLPDDEQAGFELLALSAHPLEHSLYADMPARFARELRTGARGRMPLPDLLRGLLSVALFRQASARTLHLARELGVDFLYPLSPTALDPRHARSAAWVPDLQHKRLPQFFDARELRARDRVFGRAARYSPCIVLSSENARGDFGRFFPAAAHKARVLPFRTVPEEGWFSGDPAEVQNEYGLPDRFFIVCNQFWRHKNHRVVFEALRALRERGVCPALVCTGALKDYRHPDYEREYLGLLQRYKIAEQVRLLGLIPRAKQIQLIRRALAVVQPSLFEGWSTVVEDARALGKTIALSDIPVHREQDPPHAAFFDPLDAGHLAPILEGWWESLPPGPGQERESASRKQNFLEVEAFARGFLDIAANTPPGA